MFVLLAGKGRYRSRLSDLLNHSDAQLLSVTDVKAVALTDPNETQEAPFVAINKNAVITVREIKGLAVTTPAA